jgi:hypothetical protein
MKNYVRTECATIGKLKFVEEHKGTKWYKFNGLSVIYDGFNITPQGVDVGKKGYRVKSQGANLIDVLEDEDIIIFEDGTKSTVDRGLIKYIHSLIATCGLITKVITHEQYTKLSQEVKECLPLKL